MANKDLVNRWKEDDRYRGLMDRLLEFTGEQEKTFRDRNQEAFLNRPAGTNEPWYMTPPEHSNYSGYREIPQSLFSGADRIDSTYFEVELLDLRGIDEAKLCLFGLELHDLDLSGMTNIDDLGFPFTKVERCCFADADLSALSSLPFASDGCLFRNTLFHGSGLNDARISQCRFVDCRFDVMRGFAAIIRNSEFVNCSFRKTFISGSLIENTQFRGCNFRRAWFLSPEEEHGSIYRDVVFENCDLTNLENDYTPPVTII